MENCALINKYMKAPLWFVLVILCVLAYFSHNSFFFENYKPLLTTMVKNMNADKSSSNSLDLCFGRYIYVHDLPPQFNIDILRNCSSLNKWYNMCDYISNFGLGREAHDSGNVLQNSSWYATDQFMLEVIFHNRMKGYKCLTNDSTLASAIFVPFYAGLDVGRYLWGHQVFKRDNNSIELMKWLAEKTVWKKLQGRDHFFVVGRITWDFRRRGDSQSAWGNKLMEMSETKNMTVLGIESSPWSNNEFAIPYPTYFHPSRDDEVFQWQSKMKKIRRPYLFSFVGAPRPNSDTSIRGKIINQCVASKKKCKFLNCDVKNCKNPVNVMNMFQRSKFCLQPRGDSYTRRSIFDAILAGCIPVFFNTMSAYNQYLWYLPKNHTTYSVFIPEKTIINRTVSIQEVLKAISNKQVRRMREEVIRLIPSITYAHPRSSLETLEDAFDIALKGVIDRVNTIKRETEDWRNTSVEKKINGRK